MHAALVANPVARSISSRFSGARYPRTGIIRVVRMVLRGWWLLAGWYLSNVVANLVTSPPFQQGDTFGQLVGRLAPFPFKQMFGANPTLGGVSTLFAVAITAVGVWADRDARREKWVIAERERVFPVTYGPPFDLAGLPRAQPFVGRSADLDRIMSRLTGPKESRVVALSGMGGIGKMALASEAVRRLKDAGHFQDGIAVIHCEGKLDPVALLRETLARFDVKGRQPDASDAAALAHVAQELLAGKDVLVVLDKVEPDLDAGMVISALREAGAAVLIIALHPLPDGALPPDATLPVRPLPPDDALTVFATANGRASADAFRPDERAAAERIVAVLGGHTLALRLAGRDARNGRDLDLLADELQQHPIDPAKESDEQSVERALGESVARLPHDTQRLFAALAAFATPEFSRNAALALAHALKLASPQRALDLIIDRALADAPANAPVDEKMPRNTDRERLQMHPLLRAYAATRFARWPARSRADAYRGIAAYYAPYARRIAPRWLFRDQANITGALDWAYEHKERALVGQLCLGMTLYWDSRGLSLDALHYVPLGVAALSDRVPHLKDRQRRLDLATLLLYHGKALQTTGRLDEAEPLLHRALKSYQQLKDPLGTANVLTSLGQIAWRRGDSEAAARDLERALALHRKCSDPLGEAEDLTALAQLAQTRGNLRDADDFLRQALAIHRGLGIRQGEGIDLNELGQLAKDRGHYDDAERYFTEALAIHREERARREEGVALLALGQVIQFRGRLEEAKSHFEQALAIHREVHDLQAQGVDLYELAKVALARGLLDEAEQHAEAALALQREAQDPAEQGNCLRVLGEIAQARGNFAEARECFERGLVLERAVPYPRGEGHLLVARGRLEEAQGDLSAAKQSLRDGTAILRGLDDRVGYARGALVLGRVLVTTGENRDEGCRLIAEAIAILHALSLPDEAAARAIAHQLGCD